MRIGGWWLLGVAVAGGAFGAPGNGAWPRGLNAPASVYDQEVA